MNHYDVAIYGLWYGHNYGSIITYYALSKIMEIMNLSYAMIRNPLETETNIEELHRSHPLLFAKDRYAITPLLSIDEMHKLNHIFDSFIIGSDQMWNYYLSRPYRQSYFLDFVSDEKLKLAYATSFGLNEYVGPQEEKEVTRTNLHRFNRISVRDDFSQRICREDFDINADLLLDPVFLCPVEKYEDLIIETDFSVDGEYIFAYILNPDEEIGANLKKIAENFNRRIIIVFDQSGDKEQQKNSLNIDSDLIEYIISPDVREWLCLFKNASFVLTDSFHGTCFSVIFRKNFIALKNNARGGARFPFLLNEFGLMDHMIENQEEFLGKFEITVNHDINYRVVYEKVELLKNTAFGWLEDAFKNLKDKKTENLKLPFVYSPDIWEEHYILGKSVLIPKNDRTAGGNYAVLKLNKELEERKQYACSIRFKLQTDSPALNFHIMKENTKLIQIIHSYRVNLNREWTELNFEFTPEISGMDSFMVGAMQICGEERYLAIDYINIE